MNGFQTPDPHGSGPTLRQALENAWVTLPCANAGHSTLWVYNTTGGVWDTAAEKRWIVTPRKGPPSKSWAAMKRLIGARKAAFIRKLYRGAMRYV